MTDQYTPTTEEVRLAHAESVTFHQMEEPELTEANSMFDRWLAARDAAIEAAAEQRGAARGWDEAIDHAWDDSSIYEADAKRAKAANPYRADLLEGDDE